MVSKHWNFQSVPTVLVYLLTLAIELSLLQAASHSHKRFDLPIETKETITKLLYAQFLNSNLYNTTDDTSHVNLNLAVRNLKRIQIDFVGKRNAECIIDKYGRFNESFLKFQDFNISNIYGDQILLTNKIISELKNKCINSASLVDLFVGNTSYKDDLKNVFQILLTQSNNIGCDLCNKQDYVCPIKKSQTWFYGILFVTIINLSSLCGAFVIPLSKRKFYKKVLMFLVGIAVGTLAGSGFLHLIPEAYGIDEDMKYALNHGYLWKGVVMMGGVYLFYLVERLMKIFILKKQPLENDECNIELKARHMIMDGDTKAISTQENAGKHGHSHGMEHFQSVAPVAWMIIFGDGLHNFIDGLGIGVAFTKSIYHGINLSFAVACEEFPHELGDFAILTNAGMSYPLALLMNMLSACCCYAGLVVGITLNEQFSAGTWIYSLAGGMFLYISLCDMIPELNEMGDEVELDYKREIRLKEINKVNRKNEKPEGDIGGNGSENVFFKSPINSSDNNNPRSDAMIKIKVLVIQNAGILFGFFIMLLLGVFGEHIKIFTDVNC